MKTKLLALLLLAGSTSMFGASRFFFGVGIGPRYGYAAPAYGYYAPPPPAVAYSYAPGYVRPGYAWVGGGYYYGGGRYSYRSGYWGRAPYVGARWVGPRYYSHHYYNGYWRR